MTGTLLLILVLAPLAAAAGSLLLRRARIAEYLNLSASIITFVVAILLLAPSSHHPLVYWHRYILLDAPGAWTILCTAAVYLLSSIYAMGYMRLLNEETRLPRFYALFATFAFTMLCGPLMNSVGAYWIAIELTTLVSTFLVGFELGRESIEAAWKYIIIVSAGISLALLGTILFYWGGSFVLGPTYNMTWAVLRDNASHINPMLLNLAFLLVLVGYGTKVGLAPMHTWLPDAHSEGPAPVSAMLSGALLNTAILGIIRFLSIADAASSNLMPRTVLIVLGVFSLFVAAFFIVRQEGIKRLMAYSSVEHMGILALGFGFGGPLGIAGALYHMLNHSLTKSLMFFGAGNVMRHFGTKQMPQVRRVLKYLPVTGALWLAGAVAITGAPPFGLFLSEITIMRAGLLTPNRWAVFVMLLLLIVIFIGFLNHFRQMFFADKGGSSLPKQPLNAWCVAPLWIALIPILVLGFWWPASLWHYFSIAAHQLAGGSP